MSEARITVNGTSLNSAQSMTVRVALNSFASHLREDGLGNDEHGKSMVVLYLARIDEVLDLIMPPDSAGEGR